MADVSLRIPAILLLSSCPLFLTSPALGQETQLSVQATADTVPEGLSKSEWADIRAAYEAGRHAAYSVDGGYQAHNPGQSWRTRFDGRGFMTKPDSGDWAWGLELERYGFAGAEQEVTLPTRVSADGGRVAYAWDATLEEWYENDTRGLEHGYTLHSRPERDEPITESPLTFTLAVRGGLRADVTGDGRGVCFLDEGGAVAVTYSGLTVFDADGRELDASFETFGEGGDRLRLAIDDRGARYPLVVDPVAQQAYLKASNTDAEDNFGYSVAISGDIVVVGAPLEDSEALGVNGNQSDNSKSNAGAAYVFVRSGTSWSQEAYLKASNTGLNDRFGWSVAVSAGTVVVGAQWEKSSATGVNGNQSDNSVLRAGAAYVFVRSGTSWSQQAYLKASNTGAEDFFGDSVALWNDTVVIGASSEDSNATGVNGNQGDNSAGDAGAVYVFVRSGTSWNQEAYLKASNTGMGDSFGRSVAVSGETVLVGAHLEQSGATGVNGNQSDNSAHHAGAAYVFVRSGTSWSQEAYLKASNTDAADWFGVSVATSGDTVVVGALGEDSTATGVNGNQGDNSGLSVGAAYVFVRSGTTWNQEAYLKASNPDSFDRFGNSVAISCESVVVGAWLEASNATGVDGNQTDNSQNDAGAAYVFLRSGTSWSQAAYLKASNTLRHALFGGAVAISGSTAVIGAYEEESGATGVNGNQDDFTVDGAGAAYVFDLDSGVCSNYCFSGANSTGAPAVISATGSASVAANDLLLRAEPVPNQPGVFFYGPLQASIPFGNGTRCIDGQIGRLDVVNATGNAMTFLVDYTNPPSASTQITAGSTWNFQAWFRDPAAGGASFDLSNGLSVTFVP